MIETGKADEAPNRTGSRVPRHIAIVMDGNGRWAKQRRRPRSFGHRAGQKAVRSSIEFCLKNGIEALTLYATTELAGNPQPLAEPAYLPIKVHLENSTGVLGSSCYVGSSASPIVLNLTTGTTAPPPPNKPITGKTPEVEFDGELEILKLNKGIFVDNSFAAPGANGCVLTLFGFIPISINGLVNSQSGLPSAAGNNETTQNFNNQITSAEMVY